MSQRVERVVLLGFMGAGKSTVGPRLAERLGWRYLDLDREIERRAGMPVAEIFALQGETGFRALEKECTAALAGAERLVLAPGGGWPADPANLAILGPGTLTVWLLVTPEAALQRLQEQGEVRPLLAAPDPLETAARLLQQREQLYRRAELHVPTVGRDPDEIARELERTIRRRLSATARAGTRE